MPEEVVLIGILKTAAPFGHTIYPYLCHRNVAGYLSVHERLSSLSQGFPLQYRDVAGEMVQLAEMVEPHALVKRFSKKPISPTDYFAKADKKFVDEVIRPLVDKTLVRIVELLRVNNLLLYDSRQLPNLYPVDQIGISPHIANARLKFRQSENGTIYTFEAWLNKHKVNLQHPSNIILTREPCIFISEGRLFDFDESINGKLLLPFLTRESIGIPKRMEVQYFSSFIRKIVNRCEIEAEGFSIRELDVEPRANLSFENDWQGNASLVLMFSYGEKSMLSNHPQKVLTDLNSDDHGFVFNRLRRKTDWERQQVKFLKSIGLQQFESTFRPVNNGRPATLYEMVEWIILNHKALIDHGFTLIQHKLERYNFNPVSVNASLSTKIDWYDLHMEVETGEFVIPFYKFRNHVLNGKKEYILPDGTIFVLPDVWFSRYREILLHSNDREGSLSLRKYHYPLLREFSFPDIEKIISHEQSPEPFILPELRNVVLRPYQIYGFGWMKQLGRQGFGGLLADDMGLGKTLQVIALLASYYSTDASGGDAEEIRLPENDGRAGNQLDLFSMTYLPVAEPVREKKSTAPAREKRPCSLVVMPASLIHNWLNEIKRFAPGMKVSIFTGSGRKRSKSLFGDVHIVLTTYGTLRNDIEFLETYCFGFIILDESQNIKNASSKTALSAFRLKSENRFALTGTPVENSLTDLWSQLHFLNPGMLGSLSNFNTFYASVLAANPKHETGADLLKMIRPFILRRTKEEVATELPPVTETISYCTMSEEQQLLYEREKSKIRNFLLSGGEGAGKGKSSVQVLRALMHLRQIANHPRLVDASSELGSGKFEVVTETLETVLEERHKVLVFSSFVKHLNLLESWCNEKGIRYALLTGSTTSREKVVNSFKKDSGIQLFLISLKAGGVGLNLAEAGYVFILDPWWNPAAEMQAISRAHRIGQDKNVFVYRFISTATVEENIVRLQERKTSLAQAFVLTDSAYAGLSSDEVMALFE